MKRWFFHRALRLLMLLHNAALPVAGLLGRWLRPRRGSTTQHRILLTGRFDSGNWAHAHLWPLAASEGCSCIQVVCTTPLVSCPNVQIIRPPQWLARVVGATPARHLMLAWQAARMRPDIIGGFHLLPNGLTSAVLARLMGARSVYFCVGGPVEILDGGIHGEPGPFAKMETPDPVVEQRLMRAVSAFDLVITMGSRAAEFFRRRGKLTGVHVVSGGIDSTEFTRATTPPSTDLVFVGRLAEIKRVHVFLEAIRDARRLLPQANAIIIGDGPLREQLERYAHDLGLHRCVSFVGHQSDVAAWLRRARMFVLTSRSEGLSLALMEAMMCGLPAVVSNVGDLADIVQHGINGYLVPVGAPEEFAGRIVDLLQHPLRYAEFSCAARKAAMRYEIQTVKRQWDGILATLSSGTTPHAR